MDEEADVYYVDTRNAGPTVISRSGSNNNTGRQPIVIGGNTPGVYGQRVPYGQPYPPRGAALGSLFGGMTSAQVIELIGQGFAALQSLPAAPAAVGDPAKDLPNMILYQTALADHAKSDERIRTVANIVARLLGA
jgi:hypothetical protein